MTNTQRGHCQQQKLDQELRQAVANGNIPAIRQALLMGAHTGLLADNPFVPGEQRLPAFFWAVMAGNLGVVRQLLEMGFDPAAQDQQGRHALFYVPAGPQGKQVWDELVNRGLDPNQPDEEGSVAWEHYPLPRPEIEEPARTWKAPRPSLGPTRRPEEEDE